MPGTPLLAGLFWTFKTRNCRPPQKQIYFLFYVTQNYEIKCLKGNKILHLWLKCEVLAIYRSHETL